MTKDITATMGLDVGDRRSHYCVLDEQTGEVLGEGAVATTRAGLTSLVEGLPRMRIILETGAHSPWISAELEDLGHEVVVAQASRVRLIYRTHNKSDRVDAEMLARLGRVDRRLVAPIRHRGLAAQRHRALLKSRELLVRTRTALVTHCRGIVKVFGERLPSCSARAFHRLAQAHVPAVVERALRPVLASLEHLAHQIRELDREVERLCREVYPETSRLTQVPGVGPITALAYVLTLESPERFERSRHVGAYVGLVPRRDQSGDVDKQLRITKAGDTMLRTLLVQCAHHHVGPHGPDSRLKRWADARADAGGASRRKRTIIAVARKLAVMLHRLWRSGEEYEPLRGVPKRAAA